MVITISSTPGEVDFCKVSAHKLMDIYAVRLYKQNNPTKHFIIDFNPCRHQISGNVHIINFK